LQKVIEEVPKSQVTSLQGAMHSKNHEEKWSHLEARNTEEEDGSSQPIGDLDLTG